MDTFRALLRLIGIVITSVMVVCVIAVGLIFCFPKQRWKASWKNRIMALWAAVVSQIIGLRIEVSGPPPQPPFLLVSNHLGYLDILPFWKLLRTTFVAKSEIRNWPAIGWIAHFIGIVFVQRGTKKDISRVNTIIKEYLSGGQAIILFPEGTSSKGRKVLPFKSSLLQYPASQELPVYYASLSYQLPQNGSYKAWRDVCWWGNMDFVGHFWKLLHIKSMSVRVQFGDSPMRRANRKLLTKSLQQKVEEQFEPTFIR